MSTIFHFFLYCYVHLDGQEASVFLGWCGRMMRIALTGFEALLDPVGTLIDEGTNVAGGGVVHGQLRAWGK